MHFEIKPIFQIKEKLLINFWSTKKFMKILCMYRGMIWDFNICLYLTNWSACVFVSSITWQEINISVYAFPLLLSREHLSWTRSKRTVYEKLKNRICFHAISLMVDWEITLNYFFFLSIWLQIWVFWYGIGSSFLTRVFSLD